MDGRLRRPNNEFGAWRSLVAHLLWEQRVACSNHAAPTSRKCGEERARENLQTIENRHAVGARADKALGSGIRARTPAHHRAADGLDELGRYAHPDPARVRYA